MPGSPAVAIGNIIGLTWDSLANKQSNGQCGQSKPIDVVAQIKSTVQKSMLFSIH